MPITTYYHPGYAAPIVKHVMPITKFSLVADVLRTDARVRLEEPAPLHLPPVREQLLADDRVTSAHVIRELARLATKGTDNADAREGFADTAIDHLGILAQRPVNRPHPP